MIEKFDIETLITNKNRYSKSEQHIIDVIVNNNVKTYKEIISKHNVNKSVLSKFIKKNNYDNYVEFEIYLAKYQTNKNKSTNNNIILEIQKCYEEINVDIIETIYNYINNSDIVFCSYDRNAIEIDDFFLRCKRIGIQSKIERESVMSIIKKDKSLEIMINGKKYIQHCKYNYTLIVFFDILYGKLFNENVNQKTIERIYQY